MTITERIQQLEKRIETLEEIRRKVREPDEITSHSIFLDKKVGVSLRACEHQIQALKWVESLKPTPLEFKKPEGMTDEEIIDRFKNSGYIYYIKPTENDFDGSEVDFLHEDEIRATDKRDVRYRWVEADRFTGKVESPYYNDTSVFGQLVNQYNTREFLNNHDAYIDEDGFVRCVYKGCSCYVNYICPTDTHLYLSPIDATDNINEYAGEVKIINLPYSTE